MHQASVSSLRLATPVLRGAGRVANADLPLANSDRFHDVFRQGAEQEGIRLHRERSRRRRQGGIDALEHGG